MIKNTVCKKCGNSTCTCKKSIHELAKANPDKSYKELEKVSVIKEKVFGGVIVVDSTDDCESCQ